MINRSMTPDELLASKCYAIIRVDEEGRFKWLTDTYVFDGTAMGDAERMNDGIENGDRYEVVVIDHMGDGVDADTDAVHARAFRALVRYMFCGLRQMDEQLDRYSTDFRTYRELLCFAEGYLSSAGEEIAPIVEGVTTEHHV